MQGWKKAEMAGQDAGFSRRIAIAAAASALAVAHEQSLWRQIATRWQIGVVVSSRFKEGVFERGIKTLPL